MLFENETTRQSPSFTRSLNKFAHVVHAPIVNIDAPHDNFKKMFNNMEISCRKAFLNTFFDANNHKTNAELFPIHLRAIYNTINNNK